MPYMTKNYCFFHCPKTGGTSIARALSRYATHYKRRGHQHDPPTIVRLPRKMVSVTYVRDPVAWYKSWYAFITSGPDNETSKVWWYKNNKDLHFLAHEAGDFETFVRLLSQGRLYKVYDTYTTKVNIVVTMDKMPAHFELLTGIPLGHENKSKSDFEVSDYTIELIKYKERLTYERWFSHG